MLKKQYSREKKDGRDKRDEKNEKHCFFSCFCYYFLFPITAAAADFFSMLLMSAVGVYNIQQEKKSGSIVDFKRLTVEVGTWLELELGR